jgi:hypothetical protein
MNRMNVEESVTGCLETIIAIILLPPFLDYSLAPKMEDNPFLRRVSKLISLCTVSHPFNREVFIEHLLQFPFYLEDLNALLVNC